MCFGACGPRGLSFPRFSSSIQGPHERSAALLPPRVRERAASAHALAHADAVRRVGAVLGRRAVVLVADADRRRARRARRLRADRRAVPRVRRVGDVAAACGRRAVRRRVARDPVDRADRAAADRDDLDAGRDQASGEPAVRRARREARRHLLRQRGQFARRGAGRRRAARRDDPAVADSAVLRAAAAGDLGLAHLSRDDLRRARAAREPRRAPRARAAPPLAADRHRRRDRPARHRADFRVGVVGLDDGAVSVRRGGHDLGLRFHSRFLGAVVRALLPARARRPARELARHRNRHGQA